MTYNFNWAHVYEYKQKFINGFFMTVIISFFALILSFLIGLFFAYAQNKDTTVALLKPFQKDFEYWGVALRQNDPLKKQVDEFITKAKADGTFATFAQTHLKDAKATFDELKIPFFF